ncbi:Scr1 family TA system antitoxin-like transcriptional regulator [Actinokineospora spheciospongiae]|uniref:Scr1 family TA system antitoxin-like transcriptional regulator n=1 Tax=Actinokineospora spheciospongiae TaxID=909613 RepID=UPI000D890121|nr:Scr1 family TA system antitoxin-like transcriptional regulator [Actinokineospora spheciospongiae]PWW53126.1 helix-turn-helix protein [Actinokineospora spheciospongiae]
MSVPITTPRTAHDDGVRAKTLRGLLLARALDAARVAHGFTTRALASAMSLSPAMLNRIMTGRRVPTALEIGGLCSLLDIHPARRHRLYQLTADADLTDWIIHPGSDMSPLGAIEEIADTITYYDPLLIPHPLRTTAYHRALDSSTDEHPDDTPGPESPRISRFLLHPRSLTNAPVPKEVMAEQIRHLRDTTPNSIRLLPTAFPPHPGFQLLKINHFPPVVHIDHHGTHILLEHPTSTSPHATVLHDAQAAALTSEHTQRALANLASSGRHR